MAAEPTPKYLRALGGREKVLGPEVVQPEVDSGASVEALLRHDLAAGTLACLDEAGVRTGEDPEAVHQARVATRRVRSTLRTFSKLLDTEWTDRLRDDLKWLADLLGEVRDTDVLLERFSGHLDELPAADAKTGRRLLTRLGEQRDQARRRLLGAMAQEKYAILLDDPIVDHQRIRKERVSLSQCRVDLKRLLRRGLGLRKSFFRRKVRIGRHTPVGFRDPRMGQCKFWIEFYRLSEILDRTEHFFFGPLR